MVTTTWFGAPVNAILHLVENDINLFMSQMQLEVKLDLSYFTATFVVCRFGCHFLISSSCAFLLPGFTYRGVRGCSFRHQAT